MQSARSTGNGELGNFWVSDAISRFLSHLTILTDRLSFTGRSIDDMQHDFLRIVGVLFAAFTAGGCLLRGPDVVFDSNLPHFLEHADRIDFPQVREMATGEGASMPAAPNSILNGSERPPPWDLTPEEAITIAITPSFDPCDVVKAAGATFVAETTAVQWNQTIKIVKKALQNDGFSFVHVRFPCNENFGAQALGTRDTMKNLEWIWEHTKGRKADGEPSDFQWETGIKHDASNSRPEFSRLMRDLVERAKKGNGNGG